MRSKEVKQQYTPTNKQLDNIKLVKGKFLLSGDGAFHTIQGEGELLGRPATFVRLHHCNLTCTFCDTWYTWRKDTKEFWQEPYNLDSRGLMGEIRAAQAKKGIKNPCNHIVFTGGEPMLQQDRILSFLQDYDYITCEIETNGTIPPNNLLAQLAQRGRVFFNVSPKIANSGNEYVNSVKFDVLKIYSQVGASFKFVVNSVADVMEVEKLILSKVKTLKDKVWFMPEGDTIPTVQKSIAAIRDYILRYGYNITPRFQLNLYPNKKRAV